MNHAWVQYLVGESILIMTQNFLTFWGWLCCLVYFTSNLTTVGMHWTANKGLPEVVKPGCASSDFIDIVIYKIELTLCFLILIPGSGIAYVHMPFPQK